MTNKEKREYLNLQIAYQSTPFTAELEKRNKYISLTPKSLFKYRQFDQFSFDMLENNYVFMAPAGSLDDPFDCLTNIDVSIVFDGDSSSLTDETSEYLIDTVFEHCNSSDYDKLKMLSIINESTNNGHIDNRVLKEQIDREPSLTDEQKYLLFNTLINFENTLAEISNDEGLKTILSTFDHSKETIGVCSFTTKRDNKPMWSLYGDKYKGYCVEYEVQLSNNVASRLCPVIYTKAQDDNNILKIVFKFAIETLIRFATEAHVNTEMGCFDELICTKDSDWKYQDEWRLIGNAGAKFSGLRIKNVYLGFDVIPDNEKMILDCASRKRFGVYKMNKPNGSKKITYTKLN